MTVERLVRIIAGSSSSLAVLAHFSARRHDQLSCCGLPFVGFNLFHPASPASVDDIMLKKRIKPAL